jgi:hypothetical protein
METAALVNNLHCTCVQLMVQLPLGRRWDSTYIFISSPYPVLNFCFRHPGLGMGIPIPCCSAWVFLNQSTGRLSKPARHRRPVQVDSCKRVDFFTEENISEHDVRLVIHHRQVDNRRLINRYVWRNLFQQLYVNKARYRRFGSLPLASRHTNQRSLGSM